MNGDDSYLEERLRRLGEVPLDPSAESAHRAAMAEVAAHHASPRRRFGWKAVAAAALAGFLAGSTGLAAAGALPDPAQDVAHDVLDVVGIGVPRSTEGCPEGTTYRNHGEYVAAVEAAGGDVEAAAHSDCGKPARGSGKGGEKGKAGAARADTDGDPCTGPPPWAGAHLTPEERAAAQAEREAKCGPDEDDDAEEPQAEADADTEEQPEAPEDVDEPTTTTTEVAPETTTSTVLDTTTSTTGS